MAEEPPPTKWVVVRAAEFEVYSNAGERAAMNVAEDLLLMRKILGNVAKMNVSLSGPTRVLVFRDTKSFTTVANALFGSKANKAGIYASRGDLRLIAIDASTIGARQIAYHELVHQYANATWSYLPVWFNEGIAEFYSNFGVDAHNAFVGRPNLRHVRWMRRMRPIPMREFLLADEHSRWYTSTLDQQRFYAQSWAFVHYLSLIRRGQLETFRALLEQKKPLDDAFAEAFHASYEELTRQLLVYVRRPTLQSLSFPIDTLAIESVPRAEPSTEEDVNAHIAEILSIPDAKPETVDEELVRRAEEANADRERRNAEISRRYDELLARYDEAVAHVKEGEYDEARKILDAIIPQLEEIGSSELVEVARDLRSQLPKSDR